MRKSLTPPSGRKRRKTTVGSILVPELPGHWPGRDGPDTRAMDLLREDDPPLTPDERRELTRWMCEISTCECPTCGHESGSLDYCDQVDCDCVDPFHCT